MVKVLIIMDAPETVHPDKDTSFALGEAAINKNYDVYFSRVESLTLNNGVPTVMCRRCEFIRDMKRPIVFVDAWETCPLDEFDFTLMRKDPPYDINYIFATHFLSLAKKTTVLNNPASLRKAPEKIYPFRFPGIFPPTLISRNLKELREFADGRENVIIKPLDGNGGRGVVKTARDDSNFSSLCELLTQEEKNYAIIQEYLPEVNTGDKRVILLDGEPLGAILRIPPKGDNRANLHVGAEAVKCELTANDLELCRAIAPSLKEDGLYLTGIDIIGRYITEINVTSPTGIQEIKFFDGTDIAAAFWDRLG